MSLAKSQSASLPRRSPLRFPPLRVPGQSLDEEIACLLEKFNERFVLGLLIISLTIFEWIKWWTNFQPNLWFLSLVTIPALIFIVWTIVKYRREIASRKLGRDGERTVGHALEALRAHGYQVFHDIIGTTFNIDHVIVGPAGIFTIETKTRNKPGRGNPKIIYDGDSLRRDDGWEMNDHLVQARAQASWLAELLNQNRKTKYGVQPVVLFPGWWVQDVAPNKKHCVWVLNDTFFLKYLPDEAAILSSDAVDAAANCITQYCRFSPITK